ncbi:asparagine synthase (glutamine-hydrolyzing) [Methylocystis sp.]|uniref:asparagine synthase (glutamine-hydrolyzing) n=1 Tax=Methylocystis sp. TaxID=1911079 RepID=UPI003DA5FC69
MCGIAGFLIGSDANLLALSNPDAALAAMGAAIAHRGPDDADSVFMAEDGVGLVHQRLSIIDLSPAGRQPMTSACGRYVLVYNGELYNFPDLKADLEASGRAPAWRGTSDTEVMLAAFSAWGIEASLKRINGMFAIAVWDRKERRLTLARDRAGEKPLYYGTVRGSLVFGSELRAICAFPAFDAAIDTTALGQFLRFLAVPSPYSIFRGVHKLPPGHYLTIARGDLQGGLPSPRAYWRAARSYGEARRDMFAGDMTEAVSQLDTLLRRSVKRMMIADVPLGAFLSGGFDSTLIVALMQAQSSRPIRTFTIGFDDPRFDESPHAATVAKHLGTEHIEARVTSREALDTIVRLPMIYDEPFADSSQVPTSILCALAREQLTVALSGDAGDELFGGYQRYFASAQGWKYIRALPRPLRKALANSYTSLAGAMVASLPSSISTHQHGLLKALNPAIVPKIANALSARDDYDLYEGFLSGLDGSAGILHADAGNFDPPGAAQWSELPGDIYHKMMFMDFIGYLPDDILAKVDRAAMAVGLETRIPFLDPEVIDFAWRLPLSMKIEAGRGKLILRKLVEQYVPNTIMERPKQGFGLPIGDWLRGSLRPWAEELLNEHRLRSDGLFDAAKVRALWSDHLSSRYNSQPRIWQILMFNAWLDAMRSYPRTSSASEVRHAGATLSAPKGIG